jgi:hypothetical protein
MVLWLSFQFQVNKTLCAIEFTVTWVALLINTNYTTLFSGERVSTRCLWFSKDMLPLNQTGLYVALLMQMDLVLFESEVVNKNLNSQHWIQRSFLHLPFTRITIFHVVSLPSESCVHLPTRLKSNLVILFKSPVMLISISTRKSRWRAYAPLAFPQPTKNAKAIVIKTSKTTERWLQNSF